MNPREAEEQAIRRLLRKKDRTEALTWLKSSTANAYRNIGELTNEDSIKLVEALYDRGCEKVWAVEIKTYGHVHSTDTLVLQVPTNPRKRQAIFQNLSSIPTHSGIDPVEDYRQEHLLIWFD